MKRLLKKIYLFKTLKWIKQEAQGNYIAGWKHSRVPCILRKRSPWARKPLLINDKGMRQKRENNLYFSEKWCRPRHLHELVQCTFFCIVHHEFKTSPCSSNASQHSVVWVKVNPYPLGRGWQTAGQNTGQYRNLWDCKILQSSVAVKIGCFADNNFFLISEKK